MPVTKAAKTAFNAEIKDYKAEIEKINGLLKEVSANKKKFSRIAPYYILENVALQLDIVDNCIKINNLSLEIMQIKNDKYLNDARKELYKVLQEMEELVGNDIDRTLKENDRYLSSINRVNPNQMLNFIDRIHSAYFKIKESFGGGSKWQWSFVELQARVAVITKNMTSFSDVAKYRDPRSEFYHDRKDLMQLSKDSLSEAARQYRTKYEMAGKAREDLKKSIELLSALRKIHVLFGEDEEATKLKNTIDAAKQALEAGDKTKAEQK